ncbi:helix-turn-helix domain-containing protein [Zobellia nedashkovskayae]|uniref:helix-turn-helix domain-containing protein n=1 Tax=Zobellia nedashkovskayae TaxID=2779510 RepID=UPI001D04B58B|nr:helix-turn-helix domain-containing protein [Zobellia nedashkovskayae]
MKTIQFLQTSPEQLADLISNGVKTELQQLKEELLSKNANDEILTRDQTAELLKINLSTLWAWTNKGKVKAYGISGSRRYYKRSEILDALQELKR